MPQSHKADTPKLLLYLRLALGLKMVFCHIGRRVVRACRIGLLELTEREYAVIWPELDAKLEPQPGFGNRMKRHDSLPSRTSCCASARARASAHRCLRPAAVGGHLHATAIERLVFKAAQRAGVDGTVSPPLVAI